MRFFVVLFLILLPVSFAVVGSEIPADKDVIVFQGKTGNVTFHHKLHSGLENVGGVDTVKCSTCHHTHQGEGEVKACGDCHVRKKSEAPEGTPELKKAFHLRCRGCHKYTMDEGKPAGPDRKCKLCHVR